MKKINKKNVVITSLMILLIVSITTNFRFKALLDNQSALTEKSNARNERLSNTIDELGEKINQLEVENFELKKWTSLGKFKITNYCSCQDCSGEWGTLTKTGTKARENHTVAVDPNIIPLGSIIRIDGVEYIAEDIGSAVKGRVIDVYVKDHEKGFGLKYSDVYIKKEKR